MGKKKKNRKNPINVFGIKLKSNRETSQLTKEDVAKELSEFNITEKNIEEWEDGYAIPEDDIIYKIAELYGIDAYDLLKVKDNYEFLDKKTVQIPLRKKYVGKTLWDTFGGFISTLIKLLIFGAIIYVIIKYDVFHKVIKEINSNDSKNAVRENYIVEDEYLKMLNGGGVSNEENTNK